MNEKSKKIKSQRQIYKEEGTEALWEIVNLLRSNNYRTALGAVAGFIAVIIATGAVFIALWR